MHGSFKRCDAPQEEYEPQLSDAPSSPPDRSEDPAEGSDDAQSDTATYATQNDDETDVPDSQHEGTVSVRWVDIQYPHKRVTGVLPRHFLLMHCSRFVSLCGGSGHMHTCLH